MLLIDEIDKTDQEFEAMLLELLSDFQITIPELGRIEARTHPVVLLTSNNSRELTEALKRRCLYLWLDYPTTERELEIVRLHAPELPETVARRLVEVVEMVRELDLKKPPSIAESIDWARALLLLGAARHRRRGLPPDVVDHRQAPDRPRHGRRARRPARSRRALEHPDGTAHSASLRRGCAARAWRSAPPSSRRVRRARRGRLDRARAFRAALAATLAKSPEDRRVFDLVFDRFFFRAAEAAALERGRARGRRAASGGETGGERIDLDDAARADRPRRSATATRRRCATSPASPSPRFGRRGEGSGVLGVDVQRIRRALGLRSEPGGPVREDAAGHAGADARADPPLRGAPAPGARAGADRAHAGAPARAAAERARPRAPVAGRCRTSPRCTASSRSSSAGWPRRATRRAAGAATRTSTCAARCAPRCRPAASRSC